MPYLILADILTVLHFLWIVFNLTGFFWAMKWPVLGKVHVITLGLTSCFFFILKECPATEMEWWLREQADPEIVRQGGFIKTYLDKVIYIPNIETIAAIVTLVLFFVSIYLHLWRPWRSRRKSGTV